jgi:hypothetical protein
MKPKVINNKLSIAIIVVIGALGALIGIATWLSNKSFGRGMVSLASLYLLLRLVKEFDASKNSDYRFTFPKDIRLLGILLFWFTIMAYTSTQITEMIIWIIGLIKVQR